MKTRLWILFSLVTASLGAQTVSEPLLAAYQKEFVFLDNEIRLLKDRKGEVVGEGNARVAASKKELEALEAQLLELTSRNAQKAEDLKVADSESQKSQDSFDLAQTIVNQGNARLQAASLPLFAETAQGKAAPGAGAERIQAELDYVFGQSVDMLHRLSTVRTEPASFFLHDGREVKGQVTQFGRVAALGTSAEGGGTLAPAGQNLLRLVKGENAGDARLLAEGGQPATLPLYLYPGLDKNVELPVEKSIWKALDDGGVVAYTIVLVGLAGLTLAALRAFNLRRLAREDRTGLERITAQVAEDDLKGAVETARTLPGSLGRTLLATVDGLLKNPDTVEDALQAQILAEHPRIDRFRGVITVFVGAAPMLGLLGTVSGMIRVFDTLTIYGTSDPKLVSGGISEALVTTALGLSVAIPLLFLGSVLTTWADRLTGAMEVRALRLITHHREVRLGREAV